MLHQPDPEKRANLIEGIFAIRKLHMRVLEETGFSTADEMLYPDNLSYLSDMMSYIAVGARSVENQQHRLVASGGGCSLRHEESHLRRLRGNVKLQSMQDSMAMNSFPGMGSKVPPEIPIPMPLCEACRISMGRWCRTTTMKT